MSFPRSLIPALFGRDWWDAWEFPSRIFDQYFAKGLLNSDLPTTPYRSYYNRLDQKGYTGESQVKNEKDKFQVMLDVNQFAPEEIQVKTVGNFVVVEGKQEEKPDEHGWVSRQFVRHYMLPRGVEAETVKSSLSSDGILTIEAPKKMLEKSKPNERIIPIAMNEKPAVQEE
ncbi:protein lethal(2)essential for life-like [Limulus polyphemus]|uniref:Protein lethal(2)essential for life-like n=1 Tax=Limulus polyphemus TaxID=6850 RepID=A0ABM1BMG4_LIMPO|nr:protein lethal(2)essential for life-like [Limulus polyphemus]